MGYPVAYRTSAAREQRQLSRPAPQPQPRSPANDNNRLPRTPANDNFPARLPPVIDKLVRRPAVKKAAQAVMMAHPILRVLSGLWKLYDLYDWLKRVKLSNGEYTLACEVSIADGCITPMSGCDPLWNYCQGPAFDRGINNPALCGIAGQAGIGGSGFFTNYTFYDGVIVWMHRTPGFPGQCHRGRMIQQWRRTVGSDSTPGMLRPPQHTPWTRTVPPPWAPHRWYRPEILMKPGTDYDVPPENPPYPMIPDRPDMWPGSRGNVEPMGEAAPRVAYDYAYRYAPPPRTKETKVKWTGSAQILHAVLVSIARVHGKLADLRDIIGAMEESLPKEFRLKGKDKRALPKQMENLFAHWDKMDGEKALLGIIKELAEDVVGGAGDRFRKEAAENFGWVKNKIFTSPRF